MSSDRYISSGAHLQRGAVGPLRAGAHSEQRCQE